MTDNKSNSTAPEIPETGKAVNRQIIINVITSHAAVAVRRIFRRRKIAEQKADAAARFRRRGKNRSYR